MSREIVEFGGTCREIRLGVIIKALAVYKGLAFREFVMVCVYVDGWFQVCQLMLIVSQVPSWRFCVVQTYSWVSAKCSDDV